MTDDTMPPPAANGYQPADGEGITSLTLRLKPTLEFQGVDVEATYSFPSPRSPAEAVQVRDMLHQHLLGEARASLGELINRKRDAEAKARGTTAPPAQPAAQGQPAQQAAAAPAEDGWEYGPRPAGAKGPQQVKYRPLNVVKSDVFKETAVGKAAEAGFPADQIICFDDRWDLQKGEPSYSAGVVKAKKDTPLAGVMGKQLIVGSVDFDDDGSIKVFIRQQAKDALLQTLSASTQQPQTAHDVVTAAGGTQIASQPAPPPPGDADMPF